MLKKYYLLLGILLSLPFFNANAINADFVGKWVSVNPSVSYNPTNGRSVTTYMFIRFDDSGNISYGGICKNNEGQEVSVEVKAKVDITETTFAPMQSQEKQISFGNNDICWVAMDTSPTKYQFVNNSTIKTQDEGVYTWTTLRKVVDTNKAPTNTGVNEAAPASEVDEKLIGTWRSKEPNLQLNPQSGRQISVWTFISISKKGTISYLANCETSDGATAKASVTVPLSIATNGILKPQSSDKQQTNFGIQDVCYAYVDTSPTEYIVLSEHTLKLRDEGIDAWSLFTRVKK